MVSFLLHAQVLKERRVYYLDCSYSMNNGNLNQKVCDNLIKAIEKIQDQTTELYVIPFAFNDDTNAALTPWIQKATDEGKAVLKQKIQSIYWGNRGTKTYHKDPIEDFYNNHRMLQGGITYMFLMTDGKDEWKTEPDRFKNDLKQWGGKYGDSNVYGFYVMLDKDAKNPAVENIVDAQPHFWNVESADVNIILTRAENKATINVKNEEYVDIPVVGRISGFDLDVAINNDSDYEISKTKFVDGKLRLFVNIKKDKSQLPSEKRLNVIIKVKKTPGQFYFWVTDKIVLTCKCKKEPAIVNYSVK